MKEKKDPPSHLKKNISEGDSSSLGSTSSESPRSFVSSLSVVSLGSQSSRTPTLCGFQVFYLSNLQISSSILDSKKVYKMNWKLCGLPGKRWFLGDTSCIWASLPVSIIISLSVEGMIFLLGNTPNISTSGLYGFSTLRSTRAEIVICLAHCCIPTTYCRARQIGTE